MHYDIFDSPIGTLTVASDGIAIAELHIEGDRYFSEIPKSWIKDTNDPLLKQAKLELAEYFSGTRKKFEVPMKAHGTEFQTQVWTALQNIQAGSTTTYSEIAQKINKPKAVRAVGTAVGRNPICIMVPCHRVLASNGSLGGFVAGLERKQALLGVEGAV